MALSSFSGPVNSDNGFTGNVAGVITSTSYTVATVPSAAAGKIIYVSNGANGAPVVAFANATTWYRCDNLGALSAT